MGFNSGFKGLNRGSGRCLSLTHLRTEQELWRVCSSRAVCWRNFVERCRRIYGEPDTQNCTKAWVTMWPILMVLGRKDGSGRN